MRRTFLLTLVSLALPLVLAAQVRQELDLSGPWEMARVDRPDPAALAAVPENAQWTEQKVPMLLPTRGPVCLWYRKKVDIPAAWKGKRVHLVMDGASAWSVVYFNGRKLAEDFTLNYPLDVDLTDGVKFGQPNEVLIAVQNSEDLYWTQDSRGHRVSRYPGIGNSWQAASGIWQPIRLRATEPVYIDQTFVRTSFRQKRIDVDVWVKNESAQDAKVSVSGSVKGGVDLPAVETVVPAGGRVKVTLGRPWGNPKLWSIGEPNLYGLTTRVRQGFKTVDERQDRFGFREFWVDGDHYKMNGCRLFLTMATCGMYTVCYENRTPQEVKEWFVSYFLEPAIKANCNMVRWWFQVPDYLRDVCDEYGVLINDMMFDDQGIGVSVGPEDIYWKNCRTLFDRQFTISANHPSVFYWTIQNEAWINPKSGDWERWLLTYMQGCARHIMAVDPTRFVNSDGDGDLAGWSSNVREYSGAGLSGEGILPQISWHHMPGSPANPRTFYWVEEKAMPTWNRNKPLVLGEFDMNVANDFAWLPYFGDRAFLGTWKEGQIFSDQALAYDPWVQYGALIRAARVQGVSGVHPWGVARWPDGIKAQSPQIVVPREFDLAFYGGQKVTRRFHVINGLFRPSQAPFLWSLKGPGVNLGGQVALDLPGGEHKEVTVEWDLPEVKEKTAVELTLQYGNFTERFPIRLWPKRTSLAVAGRKVAVYDPEGFTMDVLRDLFPGLTELTDLAALSGEGKPDILIVGDEAVDEGFAGTQAIKAYVTRGGRVILLQQKSVPPSEMLPLNLAFDSQMQLHSRVFVTAPNHPLMAGLDDFDFKHWSGDYYVSRLSYAKPSMGNFRILLQTSHWRGLNNTPLLELPSGAGVFLLSQLDLVSKAGRAPVADEMLKRLVTYAMDFQPQKPRRGVILSQAGSPMVKTLRDRLGIILDVADASEAETLKAADVLIVDGTDPDTPTRVTAAQEMLKAALASGKTVLWHRLTPEQAELASALVGKPVTVTPHGEGNRFTQVEPKPALLDGLSTFDTFYATVAVFPARSKNLPVAKHVVTVESGQALLAGGGLVAVPVGAGQVLFSQVLWDAYDISEKDQDMQDRQDRYACVLLSNLGLPSQARGGVADAYNIPDDQAFQVNLRPFVNMAFKDDEPANGKGGWTDQGLNDMRYFPVGPRRFQGVPFDIIVPEENDNRSCLTVRFMSPELKAKVEQEGIPVQQKAKRLFIMHSSAWTPNDGRSLADYTVHYADGTQETFGAHCVKHLRDWWTPTKPESEDGHIAWVGKLAYEGWGAEVAMFMMAWNNPHPDKEIERITMIGRHPHYVLVAISGEKP